MPNKVDFGPALLIDTKIFPAPFLMTIGAGPLAECRPIELLLCMAKDNALSNFTQEMQKISTEGNCHVISQALLLDILAYDKQYKWTVQRIENSKVGSHSWVQTGAWAIDASNCSASKPITVALKKNYINAIRKKSVIYV